MSPEPLDERDDRGFGCYMDGDWLVEVLLPGFIHAHSGIKFGHPSIMGTGIPAYVALGWVWDCLADPSTEGLMREQIIALAAFRAGVEWQGSRKRRKRIEEAVRAGWEAVTHER